jgi:hypothetical protein
MAKRTSKVAQMATDRQMHTGVTPCGVTFHIANEISVSALPPRQNSCRADRTQQ